MTTLECPHCNDEFNPHDATPARTACPHCGATWTECHQAVEPQPDPDQATIEYPIDGPARVVTDE